MFLCFVSVSLIHAMHDAMCYPTPIRFPPCASRVLEGRFTNTVELDEDGSGTPLQEGKEAELMFRGKSAADITQTSQSELPCIAAITV